jgi:adenosylcobinamide-GDP ribazoletransferase
VFNEIKNLLAFLTNIPLGHDEDYLKDSANYMPLFPFVGGVIGFLSGIVAWVLSLYLPSTVAGVLVLGFIQYVTGLHHADGLLDFGDGLMCTGSHERKISAMHDKQTGTGGLVLGVLTLMATAFCLAAIERTIIVRSLVIAETSAKLAMVVAAGTGKAAHRGMISYFVDSMHDKHRASRLVAALAISLTIEVYFLRFWGVITLLSSFIAAMFLLIISNRHFGGLTGDVLGGMNELTRLFVLIVILVVSRGW